VRLRYKAQVRLSSTNCSRQSDDLLELLDQDSLGGGQLSACIEIQWAVPGVASDRWIRRRIGLREGVHAPHDPPEPLVELWCPADFPDRTTGRLDERRCQEMAAASVVDGFSQPSCRGWHRAYHAGTSVGEVVDPPDFASDQLGCAPAAVANRNT